MVDYKNCFDDINVLILGDIILDHYLIGRVDRISPEAPVPVVLHESDDYRLGGAANVALNIKAMGATPIIVSLVGTDSNATRLVELLKKAEICVDNIVQLTTRPTTCKTRILAKNQQLLRYDYEDTTWINLETEKLLLEGIERIISQQKINVLVFQDYNKGLLTNTLIEKVIKLAQQNNIITFADPKKQNFLAYKGIDWFKPNLREINEGLNITISDKNPSLEELVRAAQILKKQLNNNSTLITLGAKGIFYYTQHQLETVFETLPTQERQIADVCGAGDTVISILALGIAANLPIRDVVELANIAGGQVCEQVGVVPINKKKLLMEFCSLLE